MRTIGEAKNDFRRLHSRSHLWKNVDKYMGRFGKKGKIFREKNWKKIVRNFGKIGEKFGREFVNFWGRFGKKFEDKCKKNLGAIWNKLKNYKKKNLNRKN